MKDLPINVSYGVSFNSDLRQPNGVASADEYAIVGRADTRNANDVTQTQDNDASAAQFEPLPTTKNTTARSSPPPSSVWSSPVPSWSSSSCATVEKRPHRPRSGSTYALVDALISGP